MANLKPFRPGKAPYHTDDRFWHLLDDDQGARYMLVACEASFVSYQCLVKLNEAELRDMHGPGWLSAQHLANRINYFVDDYKTRRIVGPLLAAAIAAASRSDEDAGAEH